jgi:hypothetical protein
MDIRNATQFSALVGNNGLSDLDPTFRQLVICMGDFSRQCNCHKSADKDRIYQNCNRLYIQGASIAASKFKTEFLSKISERQIAFYADNGPLIAIMSR